MVVAPGQPQQQRQNGPSFHEHEETTIMDMEELVDWAKGRPSVPCLLLVPSSGTGPK
jgi:hypothetical protein